MLNCLYTSWAFNKYVVHGGHYVSADHAKYHNYIQSQNKYIKSQKCILSFNYLKHWLINVFSWLRFHLKQHNVLTVTLMTLDRCVCLDVYVHVHLWMSMCVCVYLCDRLEQGALFTAASWRTGGASQSTVRLAYQNKLSPRQRWPRGLSSQHQISVWCCHWNSQNAPHPMAQCWCVCVCVST